jgi:hypothetical protein
LQAETVPCQIVLSLLCALLQRQIYEVNETKEDKCDDGNSVFSWS